MSDLEQRHDLRDSMMVLARLQIEGRPNECQVRIRNLSARGLMAEGDIRVARGTPVRIEIRHVGWVSGVVAWVQDSRFGIGFDEEIDPHQVRGQAGEPVSTREPWRPSVATRKLWDQPDPTRMRRL